MMHKLDRASADVPECLGRYRHGARNWDHVTPADKAEIRRCLEQMQGWLCAYCERGLTDSNHHVEHFRCCDDHPRLTFAWSNLFWSCSTRDSCGTFKDNRAGKYNFDQIIDPSVDDPDRFFRFEEDGSISIREGLSAADRDRAEETLRVFNLNPKFGPLRQMRMRAIEEIRSSLVDLIEAAEAGSLPGDFVGEYARAEIEATAGQPFCTAIRHMLTGLA